MIGLSDSYVDVCDCEGLESTGIFSCVFSVRCARRDWNPSDLNSLFGLISNSDIGLIGVELVGLRSNKDYGFAGVELAVLGALCSSVVASGSISISVNTDFVISFGSSYDSGFLFIL